MCDGDRPPAPPHVVIIGGGFAGLNATRALKRAPVRITLVDRRNHHLFHPLLYQVATAALNPSDIAMPIRCILRGQKNAAVILDEADASPSARGPPESRWRGRSPRSRAACSTAISVTSIRTQRA